MTTLIERQHRFSKSGRRIDATINHAHVARVLIRRRSLANDGLMLPDRPAVGAGGRG